MLSRRNLLSGLPALAATLPFPSLAATRCATADAQGAQACESGVVIGNAPTVRQRCQEWCWAACVQAVFSLQGREIAQEAAVRKIYGSEVCRPANAAQILAAVRGDWVDQYGFRFRAGAEQLPDASLSVRSSAPRAGAADAAIDMTAAMFFNDGAKRIVAELDRGNPLIIGALGHATVLTAAKYSRLREGHVALRDLTVRDPWPDNPNRRTLGAAEVRSAFFVARVWIEK